MSNRHWAVIGAGICGLHAARQLQSAGARVTVFDKARRPGGRLAVRRSDWGLMAHGAPVLSTGSASPDWLAEVLGATRSAGLAKDLAWEPLHALPALAAGDQDGFSMLPSLNALAAAWSGTLDVRCEHTVTRLWRDVSGWWLLCREQEAAIGPFHGVLLTTPPVQGRALLQADAGTASEQAELLDDWQGVTQVPCLSLLWVPTSPPDAAPTAGTGFIERPAPASGLALVVHEHRRPGAGGSPRYAIHATADWSAAHLEHDADAVREQLLMLAASHLGCSTASLFTHLHRWRYAVTGQALGRPFLAGRHGLWVAGDSCLGATAGDALASARAVAEAMLMAHDHGTE